MSNYYTPDEFAKSLMKDFPKEEGVTYSSSTDDGNNTEDIYYK